jgi:hypothetical protein
MGQFHVFLKRNVPHSKTRREDRVSISYGGWCWRQQRQVASTATVRSEGMCCSSSCFLLHFFPEPTLPFLFSPSFPSHSITSPVHAATGNYRAPLSLKCQATPAFRFGPCTPQLTSVSQTTASQSTSKLQI